MWLFSLYVIFCIICYKQRLTNLSELFFLVRYLELICVDKLVEHPYFTRSKAPKGSFPNRNLFKEKWRITVRVSAWLKLMQWIPSLLNKMSWLHSWWNKSLRCQIWLLLPTLQVMEGLHSISSSKSNSWTCPKWPTHYSCSKAPHHRLNHP